MRLSPSFYDDVSVVNFFNRKRSVYIIDKVIAVLRRQCQSHINHIAGCQSQYDAPAEYGVHTGTDIARYCRVWNIDSIAPYRNRNHSCAYVYQVYPEIDFIIAGVDYCQAVSRCIGHIA